MGKHHVILRAVTYPRTAQVFHLYVGWEGFLVCVGVGGGCVWFFFSFFPFFSVSRTFVKIFSKAVKKHRYVVSGK